MLNLSNTARKTSNVCLTTTCPLSDPSLVKDLIALFKDSLR